MKNLTYILAILAALVGGFFAHKGGISYEVALLSDIGVALTYQPIVLFSASLIAFVMALIYVKANMEDKLMIFSSLVFLFTSIMVAFNVYLNLEKSILLIPLGLICGYASFARFTSKASEAGAFLFFLFNLGVSFGIGIYLAIQYMNASSLTQNELVNRSGTILIVWTVLMVLSLFLSGALNKKNTENSNFNPAEA